MNKVVAVFALVAVCLSGCQKSSAPSTRSGDVVQQKLQELAGSGATDCGRIKSLADEQIKTAGACAMQAAQKKQSFHVAYELPGLTVAVAGNAAGKLYWLQLEQPENSQPGAQTELKSAPCPSELRIAQSGRVTCFAPGSFGMSSSGATPHGGMSMPPAGVENPHGGMSRPPAETPNPHSGSAKPPVKQN